ncbi:MAG: methyltransferase FkbM [Armatimonadetes bacterium]|jgi:FkbM family methyltransferase|nr:methyltransferase FkbM [Armatimonadota bacterium]
MMQPSSLGTKRGLLREIVLTSERFHEQPLVRRSHLRYVTRWIRNHVVPWAARTAFSEGVQNVNGVRLTVPRPPDWGGGGEFHMALGTYEKPESDFLNARLKAGDVFVDVGAHIGYVSLQAARLVGPTGCVVSVEPTAAAAELLRANLALNGFDWVRVFEAAISDHDGQIPFTINPVSPMWNRIGSNGNGETVLVPSRSVDSLMEELGWPQVTGLKIDVEGAEEAALRGSRETLERNPQLFLLVEMEGGDRRAASERTLSFFAGLGYKFRRFNPFGPPRPVTEQQISLALERDYRPLFNLLVEKAPGAPPLR